MMEARNDNTKRLADVLFAGIGRFLGIRSVVVDGMTTRKAMALVTDAGYTVRFTKGAWIVGIGGGHEQRLNRSELWTLAKDLEYIGG